MILDGTMILASIISVESMGWQEKTIGPVLWPVIETEDPQGMLADATRLVIAR